jgi:hypothetical protein
VTKWAKQAAWGLAWIHDCNVIQGDGQLAKLENFSFVTDWWL